MTSVHVRRPRIARFGRAAAASCLIVLAAGCSAARPADPTPRPTAPAATPRATPGSATPGSATRALADAYLAIAEPANHRLDTEVDGFTDNERDNLALAEADLRAQAATERRFDRKLLKIAFPAPIAAIARALIDANRSRVRLTERQARSASIAQLRSFDGRHKAADAAVEAQVRIIRRYLGLPPPDTS
jgi:hypothetical protein